MLKIDFKMKIKTTLKKLLKIFTVVLLVAISLLIWDLYLNYRDTSGFMYWLSYGLSIIFVFVPLYYVHEKFIEQFKLPKNDKETEKSKKND